MFVKLFNATNISLQQLTMRSACASKILLLASNAAAVVTSGSTCASSATALAATMQAGAGAAVVAAASKVRSPVQHMAFATSAASSSTNGPGKNESRLSIMDTSQSQMVPSTRKMKEGKISRPMA